MARGTVNDSTGDRMVVATTMLLWGSAVSNPDLVSVEEMLGEEIHAMMLFHSQLAT